MFQNAAGIFFLHYTLEMVLELCLSAGFVRGALVNLEILTIFFGDGLEIFILHQQTVGNN